MTADSDLFLTAAEIADLTGFKRRKEQLAFLKAKGYKHEKNHRGRILVARAHVHHRFGAGAPPTSEPDFTVFRHQA